MNFKLGGIVAAMSVVASIFAVSPAAAQNTQCGTDRLIDIAEMNWPSAAALAQIHNIILGEGYGCNTEIVIGDTVPTSASMLTRGSPAIAPELWTGTIEEAWNKGIADGVVSVAGLAISDGAIEGWWIPKYVADQYPDLRRVEDLVNYAEVFADPDDPGQGRFYSCPPGWGCEIGNAALFEAYGLEDTFNLFSPGSGGNLDASIVRAFTREQPIVFYYWGPTSIMGKYDMVELELPPYDDDVWQCNIDPTCETKGKSAFPTPPVIVATATWIATDAPVVAEYLSNVALNNLEISALLNWGADNKANARETAENFLATKGDIWKSWVPADVAERVSKAIM